MKKELRVKENSEHVLAREKNAEVLRLRRNFTS